MPKGGNERLDVALAERGLARSRTHARRLIDEGAVTVDGQPGKPNLRVGPDVDIRVSSDHYVSRAAHKLLHGLDAFGIDPAGRTALDVGASTGGFTQVLLERGAHHVTALDVGHGQFQLPPEPRIRLLERTNVRDLEADSLPEVDLVVCDVSFISLRYVFGPVAGAAPHVRDWIMLIKPQFEVGRERIGDGIVRDAALQRSAIEGVVQDAGAHGLALAGLAPSPIEGTHGNREFLAHFVPEDAAGDGPDPSQWVACVLQEAK